METLKNLFQTLVYSIPNIGIADVLDMAVVAFAIYKLMGLLRNTSAIKVVKGIALLLVVTFITELLHLNTVNFIISKILELGAIAVVIVFQPELRRFLERMGSRKLSLFIAPKDRASEMERCISSVVNACEILSRDRTGALIVFERGALLDEFCKSGTVLDAKVTPQLLRSIFYPKAALHDGAVLLRQDRVLAASCVLPLTENEHISTELGTRHRAGIGMSEVTDSVVVIVSEETGTVSIAVGGMLKRHLAPQMLERLLKAELLPRMDETEQSWLDKLKRLLRFGGAGNEKK